MQRNSEALTVEPCDICGDVGYCEVIVTCSKCKVNREHCYCMRILLVEIPDVWFCESCQSKNGTTSPCKVNQDAGLQASKRQRTVKTGKVKFLHEDEVIKLSSGNFPAKPIPASSILLMTRKAYVGSKKVIPKIPSQALKPDPRISPMVHGKLPRNEVQKNQMTDHAPHSSSKGPTKEHRLVSEQRVCALILERKAQTLDLHVEKPAKRAPHNALTARKSIPIAGSGAVAECKGFNIEKGNIQSIQENFHHHRKYLPASVCAWRGQFQILQAAASGEFDDGFEAQPPCVVNRKAYELSNKMPSVLQLESLPALNVLTDVFQNDSPSLQDIALYFFPSDYNERSRMNLNSIFKFMNAEKSMLRSFIDGVELLVFTSSQLNKDSRGTIAEVNEGHFLWGVFRQNKIVDAIERLPDLEPRDMDIDMIGGKDVLGRIDHVRKDKPDMESGDMDIDMIGGKGVAERIDHVLKDKPGIISQWPLEGTSLQSTSSKKVEEKTLMASSNLNLCGRDKSVLSEELRKKIKFEISSGPSSWNSIKKYRESSDKLDVPPGFEVHGKKFSM